MKRPYVLRLSGAENAPEYLVLARSPREAVERMAKQIVPFGNGFYGRVDVRTLQSGGRIDQPVKTHRFSVRFDRFVKSMLREQW